MENVSVINCPVCASKLMEDNKSYCCQTKDHTIKIQLKESGDLDKLSYVTSDIRVTWYCYINSLYINHDSAEFFKPDLNNFESALRKVKACIIFK